MSLHKKFPRASSFYAISNCPSSFELSRASGEEPPTIFSDRGSAIHKVLSGKAAKETIDPDELDLASDLEGQVIDFTNKWLNGAEVDDGLVEQRLWFSLDNRPLFSGQPDKVIISGSRALIPDYKTGWHPLDAYCATNSQLAAYAVLVDARYQDLTEITVLIAKPGKKSPPAVFDRLALDHTREWAIEVARKATASGPKLVNKGPWCRYCSGKVLCPAWKQEIEDVSDLSSAIVADIPDSALRSIAPKLQVARLVIEKLEARLYDRVKSHPERFPDWRFEKGDARREVRDMELLYKILLENETLSLKEFLSSIRVSFTELEKAYRIRHKKTAASAKAELEKITEGLVTKKYARDKLIHDPGWADATSQPDALPQGIPQNQAAPKQEALGPLIARSA